MVISDFTIKIRHEVKTFHIRDFFVSVWDIDFHENFQSIFFFFNLDFFILEFQNKSVSGSRNALTALQSFIDDNILNTDSYLQDPEIQNLVNFMMKP